MPPAVRLAFALAVAGAPLPAQDAAVRRPTFALVLDEAGAPLPGAEVTFAGWLPHVGASGPRDVLVVAADARGRARAKLREGLCYVAWAAAADDATAAVAAPIGYFAAGALLELRCRRRERPAPVPVRGLDAWAEFGPLQVRAVSPLPGVELELPLRDGAVVPPLLSEFAFEVRTADGQALFRVAGGDAAIELPPPQHIAVRVVDEHGAPVPDARLVQRVGQRAAWGVDGWTSTADYVERDLGGVDGDGAATVTICVEGELRDTGNRASALLFASAPERPAVACGRYAGAFYVDDRKVAQLADGPLRFTLPRVPPLVGHVGVVPPGTVAHLAAVCKLFSARNSYYHDARSFTAPVDAQGRVVFASVPAEVHTCHVTLLPPSEDATALPLLPAQVGRNLPFAAAPAGAERTRLPAGTLELQLVDVRGGPARGAIAYVVPGDLEGVLVREAAVPVPLDVGGEARLRLSPGTWHVLALTDEGWAAQTFVIDEGGQRERIALAELAQMRVRLCGDDGAPVPGARVSRRGTSVRTGRDRMEGLLVNLRHTGRYAWRRLRTDADGLVTIRFLPLAMVTDRLSLDVEGRRSPEFELEANDEPLELRLQ